MLVNVLKSIFKFIFDTLETIVIALALFAVAYLFLFQPHQVNGNSMLPTYVNKEMLITEKITYYFNEPKRGDVIIFKYPKAHEYDYIKRLIGLPGEKVVVENGKVKIINDKHPGGFYLDEPYLSDGGTAPGATMKEGVPFPVPEGHYVTMGDNRPKSSDSRDWGLVRDDEIVGKVWFRYWPPQAFEIIKGYEYQNE